MKDAIIFVPGLGQEQDAQKVNTIARKFAGALDRQAKQGDLKFTVIESPEEEYGKIYSTPMCTIAVENPEQQATRSRLLWLMFAALGLFQKKIFKEVVSTIATQYVTASNYLRMANQKPLILGQAAALVSG